MKGIFIFLFISMAVQGFACTTFCINKDGQLLFGRNYDWVTGAGIIHTNQRGLFKTSVKAIDGDQVSWVSKFGSTTFNQYGKEFPTGGMNEKGLVVELMWLDETQFPRMDERPAIGVLQWIQYQLDNAATTEEVIASDNRIRITTGSSPLHYLVADAKGNVATIEFLNGKIVVHKGEQLEFPVLTNNTYATSAKTAAELLKKSSLSKTGDNSLDRFVHACRMIKEIKEGKINAPLKDYAFSILENVSQGSFTKWSIVYDISNKKIHFRTEAYRNIKTFSFSSFDFSCLAQPRMFNMNQEGIGDISGKFTLPDPGLKQKIIEQAVLESRQRVNIKETEKQMLLKYEESVSCKL